MYNIKKYDINLLKQEERICMEKNMRKVVKICSKGAKVMEYKVIYSNRRTIGIYVHKYTVEVRCPKRTPQSVIEGIISEKEKWIEKTLEKMKKNDAKEFSEEEKNALFEKGEKLIPSRVEYFSKIMGVKPNGVRIGNAKSYWGCCSGNNKINFSWRLMQATNDVIDYVIVHELAHIKEHNHSKAFWNVVGKVMPDYKERREKLKKLN